MDDDLTNDLPGLQPIPFDDSDVEYVVGNPPDGPINSDDIRAKLADLEAQNVTLRSQADQTAALSKSFGDYGQQVQRAIDRQQPTINAPPPTQPGEDWNAFMSRINTQFFEKPAETIQEVLTRYDNLKSSQQLNQSDVVAKQFLHLDPDARPIYDKYRDEIDREMSGISPQTKLSNPLFYREAVDKVKAKHLDDLIAEKVAEALAKVAPTAPTVGPKYSTYSEPGGVSRAIPAGQSSASRQVFIPPHIAAEADAIGMDPRDLYNIRKSQNRV